MIAPESRLKNILSWYYVLFSLLHPPYVIDAMLREDFTKVRKPAKGLEKEITLE